MGYADLPHFKGFAVDGHDSSFWFPRRVHHGYLPKRGDGHDSLCGSGCLRSGLRDARIPRASRSIFPSGNARCLLRIWMRLCPYLWVWLEAVGK